MTAWTENRGRLEATFEGAAMLDAPSTVIRAVFDAQGRTLPPSQWPDYVRRYQQDAPATTRPFSETVANRAACDPAFRQALADECPHDPLCVPLPPDATCALCGTDGQCADDACPWASPR